MMTRTMACVLAVCAGAAGAATARPEIPYASISASATTINFDSLAGSPTLGNGEILAGQYAAQGVTFDVPNYNAYASTSIANLAALQSDPNVIWIDQGGGGGGALAVGINANFSAPMQRVGVWFGGSGGSTFSIAAYDGGTLLETVTHGLTPTGWGQEGFIAIERAEPITRVVLSSANPSGQNWNFSIDDLKFEAGSAPCYPDCNNSGGLSIADFICFQAEYVAGNLAYADCDQSGSLTIADFICFQAEYVAGCP